MSLLLFTNEKNFVVIEEGYVVSDVVMDIIIERDVIVGVIIGITSSLN